MFKKVILGLFFLTTPLLTKAAEILPPCTANGDCGLCDFILGFINIINWGYRTAGGLALVFIVYAGLQIILSAGDPGKITAAKKNVSAVVMGLLILVFAWFITNIIVATLAVNDPKPLTAASATIFGKSWTQCN